MLFGPSSSGMGYLLKGGSGVEKGILPRTVSDILDLMQLSNKANRPLILKMTAYVIYMDKIIDLMGPKTAKVSLEHFLSDNNEEVISTPTNLKAKVIPSINDFRKIMLEISKHQIVRDDKMVTKSHLIISFRLDEKMNNTYEKLSVMNIC